MNPTIAAWDRKSTRKPNLEEQWNFPIWFKSRHQLFMKITNERRTTPEQSEHGLEGTRKEGDSEN